MKIIVVSGEKSGVGKTYLAEKLLNFLKNWSALKVTVSKRGVCPRGNTCGVCSEMKKPFQVIKDKVVINQKGKDTSRLKEAGAKQVVWLKAKPESLKNGLAKALSEFTDCKGVVIEGTSVLKFIKPYLNIHVLAKGKYKICW